MKRLILTLIAAGPLLTGCQVPNLFSRQASSDLRDGQTSSSVAVPRTLFGLNKPSVEELLQQGQLAFEKQDHAAAIPIYEQVLEQEPANVSAHHRLAIMHDLEGNYADAERHYRAALDASPADANIIGDLGYSYLLQERLAEAEQYLTRARSLDPTLKNVVHHLGTLYACQGNWPKSQQMFAQILPPEQVQAEMLKWGMPAGSPSANPSNVAAAPQAPSTAPPEGTTPETAELWERMEQARQQSEAQRAQQEQQRNQLEAYQRQQAAAAGYPYDPEGERLRDQMSNIDRSTLPDNSGTLVIGPSGTQSSNGQFPVQGNNGSWPQGTTPGGATSPGPQAQQHWSSGPPVTSASQQTQFPSPTGMPTVSPQASSASPTGGYQQAQIYRGLGSQGTNPQIAGQQSQATNPIQQVGSNSGVPGSIHQAYGVGPQVNPEQAHYEVGQQAPGSVAATGVTPVGGVNTPAASTMPSQPSTLGDVNAFDAASRSAAIMGLGVGGGPMFPIAAPMTPQVSPGTGSMINGGMYPEVDRQLPTDRLMDFNQSFQYQPDGSMQSSAHEFSGAPNSIGQTMPSVMTQSQQAGTSGMPPSPWQSSAGTGSSAVPVNPLAEYEQLRANHDAQVQQTQQQIQGMTPSLYMVAPASAVNPQIPVVTGSQLMMNSPQAASSAPQTNPWPDRPAAQTTPSHQTQYGTSQFAGTQQQPLTQAPTLSQQQPLGQSPLTQQSPAAQMQPQSGPYYPVTNQLAPSPWDSVPRIDPSAVQTQTTNGQVTPPPYSPQGTSATSQSAIGTQQPSASSFAPSSQGPVIRPRQ